MKKKGILDTIISILLIIGLGIIGFAFIQEIVLQHKVIEIKDCLKINGDYYCRMEK